MVRRYRSLLVRRRAAEMTGSMPTGNNTQDLLARAFASLESQKQNMSDNKLYPNWSIPNANSKWHFEEMMPVWDDTEQSCFADTMKEMLENYRESMGVHNSIDDSIDLSTM